MFNIKSCPNFQFAFCCGDIIESLLEVYRNNCSLKGVPQCSYKNNFRTFLLAGGVLGNGKFEV